MTHRTSRFYRLTILAYFRGYLPINKNAPPNTSFGVLDKDYVAETDVPVNARVEAVRISAS